MTIEGLLKSWQKWLDDNPDADSHQRYYATGVVDGLRYAIDPDGFAPTPQIETRTTSR
jgi:hypothetical protein